MIKEQMINEKFDIVRIPFVCKNKFKVGASETLCRTVLQRMLSLISKELFSTALSFR